MIQPYVDPKLKDIKLVLIDDELDLVESIAAFLDLSGFFIMGIAFDCKNGKSLVFKTHPTLILMDKKLPDCDGLVLAKEIKDHFGDDVKIILYTGYASESKFYSYIDKILHKPMSLNKIVDEIKMCVYN